MKVRCEKYRGVFCRDVDCSHRFVHEQDSDCANKCYQDGKIVIAACVPCITKPVPSKVTQPEMIIFCGIPASGKNTWLKSHPSIVKNYTIVELDWIRREIFGHQFHANAEQFIIGMAKSIGRMLCSQNKNVLINSTGIARSIRKDWINLAQEFKYKTRIIHFDTPYDVCVARNNKRTTDKVPIEAMERMKHYMDIESPSVFVDTADKIEVIKYKG